MDDHVLSLLERQVAALRARTDDIDFLVSIQPMLESLEAEPRLQVHISDLQDEVINHIRAFEAIDAELVPHLADLRHRFVQIWPASDDSDREPPQHPRVDPSWGFTLAAFDMMAATEAQPLN